MRVKSAVIPQIRIEPELTVELGSVPHQGETLTDFVEASVRKAVAFRRVQIAFMRVRKLPLMRITRRVHWYLSGWRTTSRRGVASRGS